MASAENAKYRWYETEAKVIVEVPVKNVVEENLSVSFTPDIVAVSIKLPNEESYSLSLNLRNTVLPDQCTYKIRPSKVEIQLAKEMHSRWEKLEKEDEPKPKPVTQSKNWDKVVQENLTDKDESIEQLFAKIFAGGNDDQKRAMLKSFTESGGTVLSTNWNEVGKKKVEMKLPDGVEFKPWN